MDRFALFPGQAAEQARDVDMVFLALLGFSAFFIILISLLLFVFIIRYYKTTKANRENPPVDNVKLELAWIVLPTIVAVGIGAWGAVVYFRNTRPPEDAMNIYGIGKQWMWKFQHPTGQRENNELHLPVNQPIRVQLASQDVIHSFYVPAFRVKQDAVPGRFTQTWFKPVKTGEYHLFHHSYSIVAGGLCVTS